MTDQSPFEDCFTGWFCVQSKPAREAYAKLQLERQDFECFLPMIRSKQVRRGKKQWVTAPMFRRYLFVHIVPGQNMTVIRSTLGVSNLVAFNHMPAEVPAGVIEEIRSRCEEGVFEVPEEEPQKGDEVEIIGGPYEGLAAVFLRSTNAEERVVILLEMMQNMVQVEIARDRITRREE